ncbi:UNVERIFIED_CONTAM: hypothetical protein HDU68_012725 [Siphonaria sp. JEL0065]|nr:hypothetical protein HDU68_012725 [Siphonaria sp. JEL0065]
MPVALVRTMSLPTPSDLKNKGIAKIKSFWTSATSKNSNRLEKPKPGPEAAQETPPIKDDNDTNNPLLKPDRNRLSVCLEEESADTNTTTRRLKSLKKSLLSKHGSSVNDSKIVAQRIIQDSRKERRDKRDSLQLDLAPSMSRSFTESIIKNAVTGVVNEYKRKYLARISYCKLEARRRPLLQQLLVANLIVELLE